MQGEAKAHQRAMPGHEDRFKVNPTLAEQGSDHELDYTHERKNEVRKCRKHCVCPEARRFGDDH